MAAIEAPGLGLPPATLTPYVPRLVLEWQAEGQNQVHRSLDGSMIFADISGFTALSERLARLGKVGAEEMTRHLDGIFGAFLADSAAFGGSLLKFGGDALLIFFSGDDHVRRSCSAAVAMQTTIRSTGELDTSAGKVRLRMSVGLHSGAFDFFLVGESHRELITAGPGVTRVTGLEKQAGPGQVLLSDTTAERLPRGWLGRQLGDGTLLVHAGDQTARAAPPPVPEPLDASVFIPVALRQQLLAVVQEPEHRQVAVGFVRFSGVDQLLASSGGEVVAAALHSLVSMAQRQFEVLDVCFLGTDVDGDGGKLIAITGAPVTLENDEERLLRALSALMAGDHPLALQVGAHRGRAYVGDVGPAFRRTYTVMGDVVNTAARLMAHSEPGTVLTTEETLSRCSTLFSVQELAPFAAKGKALMLLPFRLGPVLGTRQATPDGMLRLAGRETELAGLLGSLRRAATGAGSSVQVIGEPGMGKSRLLRELEGRAAEFTVLKARGERFALNTPYHVARQLLVAALELPQAPTGGHLRARVKQLAPHLLPWLPLLATVVGVGVKPSEEVSRLNPERVGDRLTQVVAELLEIALPNPCLWLIDDAQWTDGASTKLLQFISADLERLPWLICLGRRPGEAGLSLTAQATTVDLNPLEEAEALSLVRSASQDRLLPHEEEAIVLRGGGNALFLKELASAVRPAGSGAALPETVEALVSARIDRLSPDDRGLLRAASVLGSAAPLATVTALSEGVGEPRHLDEFVRVEDGILYFRQVLFQEVAYEGLSYQRRRRLHEGAAVIIEGLADDTGDEAEPLSAHFYSAQNWSKAWEYSRLAATGATSRHAHTDAVAYHTRAIDAGRRLPEVSANALSIAWEELGEAARLTGRLEQARRAYASARRLMRGEDDAAREALLCMREGAVRYRQSNFTQAVRWYHRGLAVAQKSGRVPSSTVSQLKAYLTEVYYRRGNNSKVLKLADEVSRMAEGEGNSAGLAMAYQMRALALQAMGDGAAIEYFQKALPLYEDLGDVARGSAIVSGIATTLHGSGKLQEALALFHKNREAWISLRNVPNAALMSSNIGFVLLDLGRLDEAQPFLDDAARTLKAAGHFYAAYPLLGLIKLHGRRGDFDRADGLLEEAEAAFTAGGMSRNDLDLTRIELLLLLGRGSDALAVVASQKNLADQVPAEWIGYALMQGGHGLEAVAACQKAVEAGRGRENPLEEANALEAAARVSGLVGEAGGPASPEAARIYAELGVTTLPMFPLSPLPVQAP